MVPNSRMVPDKETLYAFSTKYLQPGYSSLLYMQHGIVILGTAFNQTVQLLGMV